MHLRAGRWARRTLPSLSPLSRPWPGSRHALRGSSEATAEEAQAWAGPEPPGFADGWREEPPSAARTSALPAARPATTDAREGTGGRCAVFALGVPACPWEVAGDPGGDGQRRPQQSRPLLLRWTAHARRPSDQHPGPLVGCRPGPFSLEGAPLCLGFRCVGLSCVACFQQRPGHRGGVQGTLLPPVGGQVCRQRPCRHSRCTWKTYFQFWSYQYFS